MTDYAVDSCVTGALSAVTVLAAPGDSEVSEGDPPVSSEMSKSGPSADG